LEKPIKIALCGIGTVGKGVLELFDKNMALIRQRIGKDIQIVKALEKDPEKIKSSGLTSDQVSDSLDFVLEDPEIDIVIELIGGDTIAKEIILRALDNGKSVVTANKALLAEHSDVIFPATYAAKGFFGFEASVAGGIPVLRNLREGFTGDEISEVSGIINGTANYILSSMTENNDDFETALAEAQKLGYAEADPTFDIEGNDTAHKVCILLNLAYNGLFDFKQIHIEGITKIEPIDIEIAREMGYTIKLLGKAISSEKGYDGRVHPSLIKNSNLLASVKGPFNALLIKGNFLGPTISYGAGAGSHPTASAVVGDIIEIGRLLANDRKHQTFPLSCTNETLVKKELISINEIETEYYLRLTVQDKAGVLAKVTKIMGDNNISIRSMIQKSENNGSAESVPVVFFTHKAKERDVQRSIKQIDQLSFIEQPTRLIRIDA